MNIVVGVDLSESSEIIVNTAGEVAKAFSSKLWIIHAAAPEPDFIGYDAGPQSVRDSIARNLKKEHVELQALADNVRESGIDVTALLIQGPAVDVILKEASKLNANMIVLGSHGRGAMLQLIVGSVSNGVLKSAECPVLIVPSVITGS